MAETMLEFFDGGRPGPRYWGSFAIVLGGNILDYYDFFIVGFLMASVGPVWHLTYGQASLILLAGGVGSILGSLFFGAMADKFGRRLMLIIATMVLRAFSRLNCSRSRWRLANLCAHQSPGRDWSWWHSFRADPPSNRAYADTLPRKSHGFSEPWKLYRRIAGGFYDSDADNADRLARRCAVWPGAAGSVCGNHKHHAGVTALAYNKQRKRAGAGCNCSVVEVSGRHCSRCHRRLCETAESFPF